MYPYVICEYEKVKANFLEFANTMAKLRTDLVAKASAKWDPKTFGGMAPKTGQFGETTIIPCLFNGYLGSGVGTQLTQWHQELDTTIGGTIPGSNVLIDGVVAPGSIPEDYMIGLAGLAFLDKAIKVSEIKMQIGDKKIPRINVEEAMVYNKPCIVFEQGFILDEEEGFELIGYVTSEGIQTIKLIGLQLNRVPNKMQVTNPGTVNY